MSQSARLNAMSSFRDYKAGAVINNIILIMIASFIIIIISSSNNNKYNDSDVWRCRFRLRDSGVLSAEVSNTKMVVITDIHTRIYIYIYIYIYSVYIYIYTQF